MIFDKPIVIQKVDETTEKWSDLFRVHARINKAGGAKRGEYISAGADQSKSYKVFDVRYFKALEDIDQNRGLYRIKYRDNVYNVVDYDDYLESHQTVRLLGESYHYEPGY